MSTNDATVPVSGATTSISRKVRGAIASIAGVSGLVALIAVFWALEPDTFGTTDNFKLIISQASVAAILAAGLSVSLTAGAFDLSFGAVMAGGGVLVAGLLTNAGVGPVPAIMLTILAGIAFGAINGLLVAYGRLPSLIATLGTQSILAGILVWATSSVAVDIDRDSSFNQIARGDWLGVPREAWIMLVLVGIGWGVSRQTIVGRNLTAVGRNPDAAHLAGIPVRRYVVGALAVTAAFAACAGILTAAKLSAGRPEVGAALLLPTFAAAFLGAAVSRDGTFNMPGAVLGALMLTTITNGLVIISAPDWTYEVVTGAVLLLAVGLSRLVRGGAAVSGAP